MLESVFSAISNVISIQSHKTSCSKVKSDMDNDYDAL